MVIPVASSPLSRRKSVIPALSGTKETPILYRMIPIRYPITDRCTTAHSRYAQHKEVTDVVCSLFVHTREGCSGNVGYPSRPVPWVTPPYSRVRYCRCYARCSMGVPRALYTTRSWLGAVPPSTPLDPPATSIHILILPTIPEVSGWPEVWNFSTLRQFWEYYGDCIEAKAHQNSVSYRS